MFEEDFDLERYWIANDISPNITGLPVSLYLFIDAFGNSEIPRLSIIPDVENHTYDYEEHLLISISDTPKILAHKYTKFNINGSQLAQVFNWIKINKDLLLDYWFQRIDIDDFENNLILLESPNIPKSKSELDVNIFISHKGKSNHNEPRVKIQNNENNKVIPNELIPVVVPQDKSKPVFVPKDIKVRIKEKTFRKAIEWIELNRDLITEYWFNKQIKPYEFRAKIKHG